MLRLTQWRCWCGNCHREYDLPGVDLSFFYGWFLGVSPNLDAVILAAAGKDLEAAGAKTVDVVELDALDFDSHDAVIRDVFTVHGDIDLVLLAFGVLGDQEQAESDAVEARRIIDSNFTGANEARKALADLKS